MDNFKYIEMHLKTIIDDTHNSVEIRLEALKMLNTIFPYPTQKTGFLDSLKEAIDCAPPYNSTSGIIYTQELR